MSGGNDAMLDWLESLAACTGWEDGFRRMRTETLRIALVAIPGGEAERHDPAACRRFDRLIRAELTRRVAAGDIARRACRGSRDG